MWIFDRLTRRMEGENHIYSSPYKSSISFYSKSIKVFQNTDLRFNKFYLLSSEKEIGNDVTFPGGGI